MGSATARAALTLGAAVALAGAMISPGGAQTEETTIAYAAEADTEGIALTLQQQGEDEPAAVFGGGITHSEVDSGGPTASGFGEGVSVAEGVDPTRAETEAPPDSSATSDSEVVNLGDGGLSLTVGVGTATSESEAEDGTPSTENTAQLGLIGVEGTNPLPLEFDVEIEGAQTASSATAESETEVAAASAANAVVVQVTVDVDLLDQLLDPDQQDELCSGLGQVPGVGGQLEPKCNDLFDTLTGDQPLASVTLGESECVATWNGEEADAAGTGSVAAIELLGETIEVEEGETQTFAEGTPLELSIGAGTFTKDVTEGGEGEPDSATGRASGAFLHLFEEQVRFALGDATCGVTGLLTTEAVIARTGGEVLPLLAGGSALVAAGLGLRRFLKRGR